MTGNLRRPKLAARSSRLSVVLASLAFFALLRLDLLPPLHNANASGDELTRARHEVRQREADLQSALSDAGPLRGPRGDFEQRGLRLTTLAAAQQAQESRQLASDARLLEQVARAARRYREALANYDAALMARTRDLGPRGETLRPATWPIVEHIKLYPPPRGQNVDFRPPDAEQIAEWARAIEAGAQGQPQRAAAAARELGRSTFFLYELVQLDEQHATILASYAEQLETQLALAQTPSPARVLLAALATIVLGLLLAAALAILAGDQPERRRVPPAVLLAAAAAAAVYYLVPGVISAAVGAGALLLIFMRWPPTAVALIPTAVFFYYRPRQIGNLSFTLAEALILIAAAALLGRLALRRPRSLPWRRWLREPIVWCALLFLLAALLSLTSPLLVDRRVALRELRRTISEPLIFLLLLLMAGPHERRLAINSFIVAGSFIASDALVRFILGRAVWAMEGVPRLIGLLPSSTALGIVLGVALSGALAGAWPLADSAWPAQQRRAFTMLTVPLAIATALTFTRGAWLGVAVAILALLALRRAWLKLVLAAATTGAGLGALSFLSAERFRTMFSLTEGTGAARREIWAAALRLLQASPITGAGLDQFVHQDPQRFAIPQIRLLAIAHPHNVVLDLWLQLGVLGMLAGLAVAGLALWRLSRYARAGQKQRHGHDLAGLSAAAMLIDMLVHGMLDQALLGADMMLIFWACIALALPEDRSATAAELPPSAA